MIRPFATMKVRTYRCTACHDTGKCLLWDYDPAPVCQACGGVTEYERSDVAKAHAVIGDEIDVTMRDGVCHADGTPRRFRSRTELRDAERATGWRRLEAGEKFPKSEPRRPRPAITFPR